MDMDISMDIHAKSVDMDMDMDVKFHIHSNPGNHPCEILSRLVKRLGGYSSQKSGVSH